MKSTLALSLLFACLPLAAQTKDYYSMKDFVDNWKVSKAFTIAVAEAMPAETASWSWFW